MTHHTRSPWWLAIVLVVALAATWWMWPSSDSAAVTASTAAAAVAPLPVDQMATPTLASPPAASAEPSDTGPSAAPIRLIGTVKAANGADSFALVRRTGDSQVVKVRTGDRIEGMTVSAIESDSIVLSGVSHTVVLEADNAAPQAPPSPVPARPFSIAPPPEPEPEPAYAGDPAPFGH